MENKTLLPVFLMLALLAAAAPARANESARGQLVALAGADSVAPLIPTEAAVEPQAVSETAPALPSELSIHERIISFTDTFDLKGDGNSYGKISEKIFSLTKAFTYEDAKGDCVAKARAELLSWGTHIDVSDCSGHPIGAIKEDVLKSLFRVYTQYSIDDARGARVADSEKVEWLSTDMTLRRPDGREIASLHRPWINVFSDNWTVKIADPAAVDPRLIVMIAAYKTSVDNDRRKAEDKRKQEENRDRSEK